MLRIRSLDSFTDISAYYPFVYIFLQTLASVILYRGLILLWSMDHWARGHLWYWGAQLCPDSDATSDHAAFYPLGGWVTIQVPQDSGKDMRKKYCSSNAVMIVSYILLRTRILALALWENTMPWKKNHCPRNLNLKIRKQIRIQALQKRMLVQWENSKR